MKNIPEHRNWDYDQIKSYLSSLRNFRSVSTNLKFLKENIINKTSFLDDHYGGTVKFMARIQCFLLNYKSIDDIPMCEVCGEHRVLILKHNGHFSSVCSRKCANVITMRKSREYYREVHNVDHQSQIPSVKEKKRNTLLFKYGYDHQSKVPIFQEKRMATCRSIYGGNSPACDPSILEKMGDTNEERYGSRHYFNTEIFKEQKESYFMGAYGVPHYSQTEEYKQKCRKTSIKKYKVPHHTQKDWSEMAKDVLNDPSKLETMYVEHGGIKLADILGVDDTTVYERLKKFNIEILKGSSAGERSLASFIISLVGDDNVIIGDRTVLDGKEIDILIPSMGIGIEYNGLFWHSSKFVDRNYHLDKLKLANSKGIRLLHVFEDEWEYQKLQVQTKIMSILGKDCREKVFARKTEFCEVPHSDAKEFLLDNHIQGNARATYRFGLKYNGELVACMLFVKRSEYEYELNRYATSKLVVGGFGKLVTRARDILKSFGVKSIVSFADKRWSNGDLYIKTGWVKSEKDLYPDYQYLTGDVRQRKQKFRRKLLPNFLEEFDVNISETENMKKHGIYQVFDCGLMKFTLDL